MSTEACVTDTWKSFAWTTHFGNLGPASGIVKAKAAPPLVEAFMDGAHATQSCPRDAMFSYAIFLAFYAIAVFQHIYTSALFLNQLQCFMPCRLYFFATCIPRDSALEEHVTESTQTLLQSPQAPPPLDEI